jgi:DNA-binding NarL/FixJ family response regulator
MKEFIVFIGGEEGKAVYASSEENARDYMEELKKEAGVQNIFCYQYRMHAVVNALEWHESLDGKKRKKKRKFVKAKRASRKWTASEDAALINCARTGLVVEDIAEELGRSNSAITSRICALKREGRLH